MFLYLIAFVAALLTIFGLPSARNSLRDFTINGYNQLLERLLPAFRTILPQRNDELPVDHEILGIEGEEEQLKETDDIIADGEAEKTQDIAKSMDEKIVIPKKSNDSFTFDYRAKRYYSNYVADNEGRMWSFENDTVRNEFPTQMVPQDMWNVLQKTVIPTPERKNADTLYEALLQETTKAGDKHEEDGIDNKQFNKTNIINEATFEKLLEEQNQQMVQRKNKPSPQ